MSRKDVHISNKLSPVLILGAQSSLETQSVPWTGTAMLTNGSNATAKKASNADFELKKRKAAQGVSEKVQER